MNISSDRRNMTYENYLKEPTSMCERKININIARNPHLINSLDRKKTILLSENFHIYHLINNDNL